MFEHRYNNSTQNKNFRQKLRNQSSPPEKRLWIYLKNNQTGYKFRRQHGIEKYILDFYCPSKRLAIEIDGKTHDNEFSYGYDEHRTQILQAKGINVLRFSNREIMNNLEGVLQEIRKHLD